MQFIAKYSPTIKGVIKIPGDKSMSHRAVMLGSIANGMTTISGFLPGKDTIATLNAFKSMGVNIVSNNNELNIYGVGLHGLKPAKNPIDLGNSGTAVRLISGILAGQKFVTKLVGDESLSKRPMDRIIKPLISMGAAINSNNNKLPITINRSALIGMNYKVPVASAQVKSCILLAGLYASGTTRVEEITPTRNHLELMLSDFGAKITVDNNKISLTPSELKATKVVIPGDISSAAFFMVAASIAKDADITLSEVNINPTRTGVIDILLLMGAKITIYNVKYIGGEKIADINILSTKLKAIKVPKKLVPLAIDEFPVLFIAMACAEGESIVTNAAELRVKECDRIAAMSAGLKQLGIANTVLNDGIKITGGTFGKQQDIIESYRDHRIAMSFAVASCACPYNIRINEVTNVATSFPNFQDLCNAVGINITSK